MDVRAMARRLTVLAVVGVLLVVGFWTAPAASQARPIRIGLITPTTGVFAANGRDMINGFTLFWEERNFSVAGRRVEIIVEDDVGAPANTLTKARKLVEQDRVDMLVGPLTANSGLALRDFVHEAKVPTIFPIVSADDITQRRRTPYIVRVGWTSSQPNQPFGEWIAKNTSYRRVATIGYDFAFGHENVGGFQRTFEENGGRIVQRVGHPGVLEHIQARNIPKEPPELCDLLLDRFPGKGDGEYGEGYRKPRIGRPKKDCPGGPAACFKGLQVWMTPSAPREDVLGVLAERICHASRRPFTAPALNQHLCRAAGDPPLIEFHHGGPTRNATMRILDPREVVEVARFTSQEETRRQGRWRASPCGTIMFVTGLIGTEWVGL